MSLRGTALGLDGVPWAEAASQFEVLALGGFEGLPQGLDQNGRP
ncbi:hypothetical protein AB0G74_22010 [Streptomyces sp. NPDC020875]